MGGGGEGERLFKLVHTFARTTSPHILYILTHGRIEAGTPWRICLRYNVTNRKVAGLIPDGVIGIFN